MNIFDICPCGIWYEILNYLDKIIDTCEYISWKFKGIIVN